MADKIISDIIIKADSTTSTVVQGLLRDYRPPGYSDFVTFTPGDYTFKDSKFKTILRSLTASDRTKLIESTVEVDVPDIIDSGTGTIVTAESGIAIVFNREFNIIPDITIQPTSGPTTNISGLYELLTIDGFTGYLVDSSDTKVTGSFSWFARGY